MSDYEKLKELAEATKGWDNLKSCWPEETEDGDLEVNWFVGAVTEDDDKYPVLEVNTAQYDALEDAGRLARYYAAANPATVLALIAENERLSRRLEMDPRHSIDGIEARNATIKGLDELTDRFKAETKENEMHMRAFGDVMDSQDKEIQKLKAENAGLRTGFKAYEQVVQGLKAENEALRKALGDCADELSAEIICKHGGQKLEDMHPVTRRLYERDMETVVEARAAMGKGEQS